MQQTPYKTCPMCNQPAVLSMQVCGRCGYSYRQKKNLKPLFWILGILGSLCVIFALFFFTYPSHPLVGKWICKEEGYVFDIKKNGIVVVTPTPKKMEEWKEMQRLAAREGQRIPFLGQLDQPFSYPYKTIGNAITINYKGIPTADLATDSVSGDVIYQWALSDDRQMLILVPINRPEVKMVFARL